MDRSRRDFVKLGAIAAASLMAGPAFAAKKKKKKKPKKDPHGGQMDPELRKKQEEHNPTTPEYEAPAAPLVLPAWKYGKNSFATDTVLMFRGNPSHTFYGTGPLPTSPRLHWKYRMEDFHTELRGERKVWQGTGWTGTAAKYGDYVFVGSVGRNLYAFEAATGKVAWRFRGSRMFKSSVCIYENKLYIGNVDDYLRCFDAATGKVLWKHNSGTDLDSSPCVVDGRLYIAGESGNAWCIDPADGKVIWKTYLGGTGTGTLGGSNGAETSPAIADGEFYAATYDGDLFCVDIADGKIKWKARTDGDTDASPVVSGEFVYACAEEDAPRLNCFARADGREVWRYTENRAGYWSTPAIVGDRIWVGGADGRLHCVDAKTGKQVWNFKTGGSIWSSPAVIEDRVVVGSMDGNLYILDAPSGKELWRYEAGGRFLSSPCVVDGTIWIGTATGMFYCFGA